MERRNLKAISRPALRGLVLLMACELALGCHLRRPTPESAPIFQFSTDETWLNLHHFLYVLARAQNGEADSRRDAVARAPADAERALRAMNAEDRRVWQEAIDFYAHGVGRRDPVFDAPLARLTASLAAAGDGPSLEGAGIDSATRATLEQAAPTYRASLWVEHRAANEAWLRATQAVIDQYGRRMLAYLTKAYDLPWPEKGYPVHLSGYTNWAGAYSTTGNLLVVATTDTTIRGALGFEAVFHESMHQWDDAIQQRLSEHARRLNRSVPDDLSHAMIFYTTGEAMKTMIPGHKTYAEVAGVWRRGMGRYLPALRAQWQPYLGGEVTLDRALSNLIAASPR